MGAQLDLDDVSAEHPMARAELARLRVQLEHALAHNVAEAEDAARYRFLEHDFSAGSLNIGGNHSWVYRRNFSLRGPTLAAAIDAARMNGPHQPDP